MNSSQSSPIPKPSLTNMDWYAIACKIRKQNQELKEKTVQLEKIIEEQKNQMKVPVIKNQEYQKQKSVIESLNSELKKNQQLAAGLERECSLLQDKYNEIQHQLKQTEKENKELQIRLQRQQRYNIQYKAALDQYLTVSSPTSPDVESLRIESWSEDRPHSPIQNPSINLSSEDKNINQENPELVFNNLSQKTDEDIVYDLPKNLDNSQSLNEGIKPSISSILSIKNLSLPPLNKSEKTDNNLEVKNSDHSDNSKQKSRQSFLKLPKFGK
jgi:chromosome segregation ATPase